MKKKVFSMMMMLLLFVTGLVRAEIVTIGSGDATNNYLPSYSFYNYSLTQQIYTADEIGFAGTISSIAFYNAGSVKTRSYNLYLVTTDKTEFSSTSDWIPVTASDQVFSGSVTMTPNEWTTITFDTPFVFDGLSNLAVIVDDNTGSWESGMSCRAFNATGNQAIRIYSDYDDYDPFSPSQYTGATFETTKNQIQLDLTIDESALGMVAGHVYQFDGVTPIANARVSFASADKFTYVFTTDAEGYYTGQVFGGNYNATATCSGYQDNNLPSCGNPIAVAPEGMVDGINFVMREFMTPVRSVVSEYYPDAEDPTGDAVKVYWSWGLLSSIEDFETGDFSSFDWQMDATYPWVITDHNPYEGTYCMKSGNAGAASSTSTMQVLVDVPQDGMISFYQKASSESNYDKCYFYIDGQQMLEVSGPGNWIKKEYPVAAGEHNFKWAYTKDSSVDSNDDCYYIDYIDFEAEAPEPIDPGEGVWYYYDDGVNQDAIGTGGGVFYWGVMFPAGLYQGNVVTMVSAYDYMAMDGTVTIYNDGATAPSNPVGQMDVSFSGSENFVEFIFTSPVVIDPSKNLWVIFENASGATYPAAVCDNTGDANGRWVSLDGTTWEDLASYDLNYTFMVRAYIGQSTKGEVTEISIHQPAGDGGVLAVSGNGPARMAKNTRSFLYYRLYRTNCYNDGPYTEENTVLVADNLTDTVYVDNSWADLERDSYKYGIGAVYTEEGKDLQMPRESEIKWARCIDKGMNLGAGAVNVTVTLNSGDSPEGTKVTFTNHDEMEQQLYPIGVVNLGESGTYSYNNFRCGEYTLEITKDGYEPVVAELSIWEPINLTYELIELIPGVEDLYVSHTGWAMWGGEIPGQGATVILTAGDIWGDGTGYQMLLDADANAYGTIIPETGALSSSCSGNEAIYAEFEYKIPVEADGNCSTQNIVFNNSVAINIPAGTYDWCVANPTPGDRIWISAANGNVGGRQNDYVFEAGKTYEFTISMYGSNDGVDVVITGKGETAMPTVLPAGEVKSTADVQEVVYTDKVLPANNRHFEHYNLIVTTMSGVEKFNTTLEETSIEIPTDNLVDGESYICKVASIYSSAPSEWSQVVWQYISCDHFAGVTDLMGVSGNNGNELSWTYPEDPDNPTPPDPQPGDSYDFEDGTMQGWTTIDADGDGFNWDLGSHLMSGGFTGHGGSSEIVTSQSYDFDAGALTPDNYFVSPQVSLGGSIHFWACAQDASYAQEHFGVAVSTGSNTNAGDFTTIWEETMSAKGTGTSGNLTRSGNRTMGTWYEFNIDLSAYAGQTGYVAIRHFNCTDWFYLDVDDISFTTGKGNRTVIFNDNFEGGDLTNWTLVDVDNDGENWEIGTPAEYGIGNAHSGTYCATSWSWNGYTYEPGPDNYMISPAVNGATSLNYFVATNTGYPDHYGVYASTTGTNISDFSLVFEEDAAKGRASGVVKSSTSQAGTRDMSPWTERTIELPAGTQYIAFRHFNSYDMNYLFIDDVTVYDGEPDPEPVELSVLGAAIYRDGEYIGFTNNNSYVDQGVSGNGYEYCVRVVYNGEMNGDFFSMACPECVDEFGCPAGSAIYAEELHETDQIKIWWGHQPGLGEWYYYDDGNNQDAIGTGGGQFWWGVMFPGGLYEGNLVTKVAAYDYMAMSGTVTIYNDGATSPSNAVGQMNVNLNGIGDFVEFEFAEPVAIDPTKNVWVVFYNESGATYPAAVCNNTGDANGRWVSLDGTTWEDLAGYDLNYTFMVRAYIENGKGEVHEISIDQPAGQGGTLAVSGNGSRGLRAAITKYNVYRSTNNSSYSLIGSVNAVAGQNYYEFIDTPSVGTYYYQVRALYDNGCESDPAVSGENPAVNYVVAGVDAVAESIDHVSIYPNPTRGELKIEARGMNHISVVSVLGQVVYDATVSGDELTLNMAQFNTGMYMVRIACEEGVIVKRVTVVE